ncbi:MAG: hypothetical protein Q7S20_04785 [Gemmatimonadaceae bacterium]|nr:hypothetical protein [Gemmatimonadaceae bacterium]
MSNRRETGDGVPRELGGLPAVGGAHQALQEVVLELRRRTFRDMSEAQAFVDARMAAYNDAGQEGLEGLSPNQMRSLLDVDWFNGQGLRLATDLSLDDLSHSRFLFNVRALLLALRDDGPAPATQAGNLSRAFVRTMLERLRWEGASGDELNQSARTLNEADVWPLHVSRLVATLAGLVVRRKGFRISARGKLLLRDSRAGELHAALFNAYYKKLNLAYTDTLREQPRLQSDIAFSLWVVRGMARNWVSEKELSRRVWRPEMTVPADRESPPWFDEAAWRASAWLVRPLEWFGLLEVREVPGESTYAERVEVRKTPVFDRFLHFQMARRTG